MHVCVLKLEKVYNPDNEEDDMVAMEEERLRMREHVMNEVGQNSTRTAVDPPSCVINTVTFVKSGVLISKI